MGGGNASMAVTLALYVGFPAAVLFVGWLVGHLSETKHERSLVLREEALEDIETTDMRNPPGFAGAEGSFRFFSPDRHAVPCRGYGHPRPLQRRRDDFQSC